MKRLVLVMAVLALAVVGGCKTLSAPFQAAETPEQKAYALYGTFVVFEEVAASVATDPATPVAVKNAIKAADAEAKPDADSMISAARLVIKVQAQIAAGTTPDQQLEIVNENLVGWVTEAQPKIVALQCAVNPRQKVCK